MYRLQFHNFPKRVLYMFKDPGDNWYDITGAGNSVTLRFDPVAENGIFTPIIKTSLQVRLIRRKDEPDTYSDIIEADDNEWNAVVVENGELEYSSPGFTLTAGASLVFKGLLTLETYGEQYKAFADVNLTFHDRLGHLSESKFIATSPKVRVTELLGQLLQPVACSKYLFIEFPFDVDIDSIEGIAGHWFNLRGPRNMLLDVSEYHRKPKLDLLTDILEHFGYRLYCDFYPNPTEESTPSLDDCGVIRMELVEQCKEVSSSYLKFILEEYAESGITEEFYRYTEEDYDSEEYEQTPTEEARTVILMDTPTYPIFEQSGAWQLVRKAKEIDANVDFNLRDNLLFPDEFLAEDFIFSDGLYAGYNLQYPFWGYLDGHNGDMFVKIKDFANNQESLKKAYANIVGNSGKYGILVRDNLDESPYGALTNTALVIKDTSSTFKIDSEVWTNVTSAARNLYISLFAIKGDTLYHYNATLGEWITNPAQYSGFRIQPGWNSFDTGTFSDIPQPPAIAEGASYQICLFIDAGNPALDPDEVYYLTSLKIVLSAMESYPKKLQVLTSLSETRRSPVEVNPKFYNVPNIKGASGLYDNGMYGVDLDFEEDSVLKEAMSGIIPLPLLLYGGNNATMLVHLSDMVGIQHLHDRWKFDATLSKSLTGKKYSLTTGVEGEGTITVDPVKTLYDEFEQVTLTADSSASEGFVVQWVVNGEIIPITEESDIATLTLTMDEDKDVKAVFGGIVFYEEFESWGGIFPEELPTGWTETVFLGSNTYAPDSTIYVTPVENGEILFYKELNNKGIRINRIIESSESFTGKLIIEMPITEASGISIDPFALQIYTNSILAYQKIYNTTYNQLIEISLNNPVNEIRLIVSSNGGAGQTVNVRIPYLKITKIG